MLTSGPISVTEGKCLSGVCVDKCQGVVCSPSDECHVAACDSVGGTCSETAKVIMHACMRSPQTHITRRLQVMCCLFLRQALMSY